MVATAQDGTVALTLGLQAKQLAETCHRDVGVVATVYTNKAMLYLSVSILHKHSETTACTRA